MTTPEWISLILGLCAIALAVISWIDSRSDRYMTKDGAVSLEKGVQQMTEYTKKLNEIDFGNLKGDIVEIKGSVRCFSEQFTQHVKEDKEFQGQVKERLGMTG